MTDGHLSIRAEPLVVKKYLYYYLYFNRKMIEKSAKNT